MTKSQGMKSLISGSYISYVIRYVISQKGSENTDVLKRMDELKERMSIGRDPAGDWLTITEFNKFLVNILNLFFPDDSREARLKLIGKHACRDFYSDNFKNPLEKIFEKEIIGWKRKHSTESGLGFILCDKSEPDNIEHTINIFPYIRNCAHENEMEFLLGAYYEYLFSRIAEGKHVHMAREVTGETSPNIYIYQIDFIVSKSFFGRNLLMKLRHQQKDEAKILLFESDNPEGRQIPEDKIKKAILNMDLKQIKGYLTAQAG